MAFNPQDYDVKPIGDAGLTERTSLDGSERILVQAGADVDVNTTPMQFFKYQVIKSKIDAIKEDISSLEEDISSLELSLEGVNASLSSHNSSISGLNTAVSGLNTAVGEIEDTLDSVQGTLDSVQGSISGLNTAVGEIEDTLDSVQGSTSGVEMMNINAKEANTYSIGTTRRFLNIVGKNFIGESMSMNGKPLVYIVASYRSGTQWYRIWSDGWKETGGAFSCDSNGQGQTFAMWSIGGYSFNDSNYSAVCSITTNHSLYVRIYARITTGINIASNDTVFATVNYVCRGY